MMSGDRRSPKGMAKFLQAFLVTVLLSLAMIPLFSIQVEEAFALGIILYQTSCESPPLNGSWDASKNQCTVGGFTLGSNDSLYIPKGTDLWLRSGTITINGTLNNAGTSYFHTKVVNYKDIINSGLIDSSGVNVNFGTIENIGDISISSFNSSLVNHGKITGGGNVTVYGILTNFATGEVHNSNSLKIHGSLINNGTITNHGDLGYSKTSLFSKPIFNNYGNITNNADGTFNSLYVLANYGWLENYGNVRNNSVFNNSGTIVNYNSFINNSILDNLKNFTNHRILDNRLFLTNSGQIDNLGTLNSSSLFANYKIINNHCGGTIIGTVSVNKPINLCKTGTQQMASNHLVSTLENAAFVNTGSNPVTIVQENNVISISNAFRNTQQHSQDYIYVLQIMDEEGVAVDMIFHAGSAGASQEVEVSSSWTTGQTDKLYIVQVFVWDSIGQLPTPLSDVSSAGFIVA